MSKNLPLWNKNETDVLIEHRLQYGHILLLKHEYEALLKKIQKIFKFKKPVDIHETLNKNALPSHEPQKTFLLNDEKVWHFIFAECAKDIMAIYAPHFLFFNSSKWIQLNRKTKGWLFYVDHGDSNEFFYTIFNSGNHYCNACYDLSGIHKLTHEPVDVYFNKELIFHKKDDSKDLTPELIEIISNDVVIANDTQKGIKFLTPIKNDEILPVSTYHVVFEANDK